MLLSTSIVAVAFDVPPVMVSPTSNLPVVPAPDSRTIFSPALELSKSVASKRRVFEDTVSSDTKLTVPLMVSCADSRNL